MITIKRDIQGIEYIAEWKGLEENSRLLRGCIHNGVVSQTELSDIIFNDIIISPKVNIQDFDNIYDFKKVFDFGIEVISGKIERKMSKSKAREEVEKEWGAWRLVLSQRGFTYDEVFRRMTPNEILKANIALDIQLQAEKKAMKKR